MSPTQPDSVGEPDPRGSAEVADLVAAAARDESLRRALSRAWSAGYAAAAAEPLEGNRAGAAADPFRELPPAAARPSQRPRIYSATPDPGSFTFAGLRLEQPALEFTVPGLTVQRFADQ